MNYKVGFCPQVVDIFQRAAHIQIMDQWALFGPGGRTGERAGELLLRSKVTASKGPASDRSGGIQHRKGGEERVSCNRRFLSSGGAYFRSAAHILRTDLGC